MKQLAWLILWVLVIPLILYCVVLFLALLALKHPQKGAVVKAVWSEVWLLGLGANLTGGLWMFLRVPLSLAVKGLFMPPIGFYWRIAGAAITGVCLYFMEKHVLKTSGLLTGRERRAAALALAVITAPYLFFIPVY